MQKRGPNMSAKATDGRRDRVLGLVNEKQVVLTHRGRHSVFAETTPLTEGGYGSPALLTANVKWQSAPSPSMWTTNFAAAYMWKIPGARTNGFRHTSAAPGEMSALRMRHRWPESNCDHH